MLKQWILIMGESLGLLGLFWGSSGVGRALMRRAGLFELTPAAETACAAGLGLALLSYAFFTLAAVHALSPLSVGLLSLAWMALGFLHFRLPKLSFAASERAVLASPWAWLLGAFLLAHVLLNAVSALTPAWDWDGTAYHLALPKIYLAAGGFVFRPDIYHNLFPQLAEMLYLPGMLFPWGSASKLVHWGFGLLGAWSVYALGRERGWNLAALLGAVLFYSQFLVHIESGTAFIDLASAAYVGLTLLAFQRAVRSPETPQWKYLAAFMAGCVAATKWHGLIVLALVGLLLWLAIGLARPRFRPWRQAWGVLLWGSLPVLPYFLRAWWFGHNPIWPLGYALFGGAQWDAAIDRAMTASVTHFAGYMPGWHGLLRLPYDLAVHGQAFGLGGHELRYPLLGGLLLAGVWLVYRKSFPSRQASNPPGLPWPLWTSGALAAFILIWFFSSPQVRYLLPLGIPAAWFFAGAARQLASLRAWTARLGAGLAVLLAFSVHPPLHGDTFRQIKTVIGRVPPEVFLQEKMNHYAACSYLNAHADSGSRVLLFQENRGFYLNREYLWGDPLNQSVINYRLLPTPDALWDRLQALNIQWVLYRTGDFETQGYYTPEILARLDQVLAEHGQAVFSAAGVTVFRLKQAASGRAAKSK